MSKNCFLEVEKKNGKRFCKATFAKDWKERDPV